MQSPTAAIADFRFAFVYQNHQVREFREGGSEGSRGPSPLQKFFCILVVKLPKINLRFQPPKTNPSITLTPTSFI